MINNQDIMNTLLLTLLAATAVPAIAQQTRNDSEDKEGPFVHTVFFWLKDPDSEADRQQLHDGLKTISEIDLIQQGYIGVPADTDRDVIDSSYDFSITFIFRNKAEEQAYQTHPTHLEFVEEHSELWKRVVVYDAVPPEDN